MWAIKMVANSSSHPNTKEKNGSKFPRACHHKTASRVEPISVNIITPAIHFSFSTVVLI